MNVSNYIICAELRYNQLQQEEKIVIMEVGRGRERYNRKDT